MIPYITYKYDSRLHIIKKYELLTMIHPLAYPRNTKELTRIRSIMSVHFTIELEFEMLVFQKSAKPEYPKKNHRKKRREPTTNSTYIWHRIRESNPEHNGGRRALSSSRQLCFLIKLPLPSSHQQVLRIRFGQNADHSGNVPRNLLIFIANVYIQVFYHN